MPNTKRTAQTKQSSATPVDTATRILDVAEDVFARYGYLAARLDEIAKTVGIRRPSLFHHFRNKETLYLAVMDRWIDREAEFFDRILGDTVNPDPEIALEKMVDATFDFLVDNPGFAYLSLHTLAGNQTEDLPTNISAVTLERWQTVLEAGQRKARFRDISVAECMALIGGMTLFYIAVQGSQTTLLNAISNLERKRLRNELQRLVRSLVLIEA